MSFITILLLTKIHLNLIPLVFFLNIYLFLFLKFFDYLTFCFQDNDTSEADNRLHIDQVSERGWSETLNSISKADSSPDEVSEIVEEVEPTLKNSIMAPSGRSHTQK